MFLEKLSKTFKINKNFFKYHYNSSCKKKLMFGGVKKFINGLDTYGTCHSLSSKILCNSKFLVSSIDLKLFHTSVKSKQTFLQNENIYADEILKSSGIHVCSDTLTLSNKKIKEIDVEDQLLSQDWATMSQEDILKNFELLSVLAQKKGYNLHLKKYDNILMELSKHCSKYSDKDLYHILECLSLWKHKSDEFLHDELRKELDKEFLRRFNKYNMRDILLINYRFYHLNMVKISNFTKYTIENLNVNKMSVANLMQFAFLMKTHGRTFLNLKDFELCVDKYFDKMSIDELGIIAMAFFKYKAPIHSEKLLIKIISRLKAELTLVSDISLSAILKLLRLSFSLSCIHQYDALLKLLVLEVPKRTLQTLIHMAHMQGVILLHNQNLIAKILKRFQDEIKHARLKDIERILFTLYIFNYKPEDTSFYSTANKELLCSRRKNEIENHLDSFVYCALFMMQMNYFPQKVIDMILQPEFIKKLCQDDIDNIKRDLLVIDYCIEIEHHQYNGPRLKKSVRNLLVKKFGALSQLQTPKKKLNHNTKLLIDVAHYCKKALGTTSVVGLDFLLPHIVGTDIVLCYNSSSKKFISPNEMLSKIPVGEIKYAPNDGNNWLALVVGSHNFMTRNTLCPTGILAVHLRHLKKIGYTPILISYDNWQKLISEREKISYILNILPKNITMIL